MSIRRRSQLFFLCLLMLLVFSVFTVDIEATGRNHTGLNSLLGQIACGTIYGEVKDALERTPIAGAIVDIGGAYQLVTDDNGVYAITIPGGYYAVTATAGGYRSHTIENVYVGCGHIVAVDFDLYPLRKYLPIMIYNS